MGAKLLFFCGKMAAGKSTLARALAEKENALLLVEDEFLERLYPGEIKSIGDYVKYTSRIKGALAPLIQSLLSKGVSVVLDFPGNTRSQRAWFRAVKPGKHSCAVRMDAMTLFYFTDGRTGSNL